MCAKMSMKGAKCRHLQWEWFWKEKIRNGVAGYSRDCAPQWPFQGGDPHDQRGQACGHERREQARDIPRLMHQIVVERNHQLVARRKNPSQRRVRLAAIDGGLNNDNIGQQLLHIAQNSSGAVGTPVIYTNDLKFEI